MSIDTSTETATRTAWPYQDWRRVGVYGLGISGRAATELLLSRGVQVLGLDDGPAARFAPAALQEQSKLAELLAHQDFVLRPEVDSGTPELWLGDAALDAIVVSPGVPSTRSVLVAARRLGLPIVGEVELAFPLLDGPVVGITGTNGKSTTTALTGAMLQAAGKKVEVCGNIGEPLSGRVEGEPGRCFVVELSSFQLEALQTFRCRAAALLNIAPDHLDRYPDFEAYAEAKKQIFARQQTGDVAVLNGDDPWTRAWLERGLGDMGARVRMFSHQGPVEDGCYLDGEDVVEVAPDASPRHLFARSDLQLGGLHNLENAMAAALLARSQGADPAHLQEALRHFEALPHRMQALGERRGVTWFDDSKGTNTAATAKSLAGFDDGSVHLILGGVHKGDDLQPLHDLVASKVRRLYLVGQALPTFRRRFADLVPCEDSETLERAVQAAAHHARPGESVLLSPACASFDQFTSFAHRGRRFQELVAAVDTEEVN